MAVSTSFLVCYPGQWTSLCPLRDERKSLLVSAINGDLVLSTSRAAPLVTFGSFTVPSGIYLSASFGVGPGYFELTQPAEGELVAQEWFAWPVVAPSGAWTDGLQFNAVSSGNPAIVSGPLTAAFVLLWTALGTTGAGSVSVTSDVIGLLTPTYTYTLLDGAGDQLRVDIYLWSSAGGETITCTPFAANRAQGHICWCNATGVDTTGSNSNTGTVITTTATSVPLASAEPCFVVDAGISASTGFVPSGDVSNFIGYSVQVTSPDGTHWRIMDLEFVSTQGMNPVTVTMTANATFTHAGSRMATLVLDPAVTTTVTAQVIETYSVEALENPAWVDPTQSITVELPKLSREGVAALHDLLRRLAPEVKADETPNAD